jgi:hypothetical protein
MTCEVTSPPIRTRLGLTQVEASRRLALEGANVLDEPRSRGLVTILAGTLREPIAAGAYWAAKRERSPPRRDRRPGIGASSRRSDGSGAAISQ